MVVRDFLHIFVNIKPKQIIKKMKKYDTQNAPEEYKEIVSVLFQTFKSVITNALNNGTMPDTQKKRRSFKRKVFAGISPLIVEFEDISERVFGERFTAHRIYICAFISAKNEIKKH